MYHRILVPLDGSATAERGLREAIALAADQKATLLLLYVVDNFPLLAEAAPAGNYQETLARLRHDGEELVDKGQREAAALGLLADTLVRDISQETVADAIIDEARRAGCDLIVMGTHGRRGISRLTLGSQAELVVRSSPVPVLLVRQPERAAATAP
jgi:nucleotide-binding universal stress UspA family protein